jgi:hypothetical protein
MLHVFVGYDPREHEAYEVCRNSLIRYSSEPVVVTPLKLSSLAFNPELYNRTFTKVDGQRFDTRDQKPFSTDFSFSRFLVPEIARRNGLGPWVMFVDCDFLFRADVARLFEEAEVQNCDVAVVQHNYIPAHLRKMDNQIQEPYSRKLWSSLMLFKIHSPACLRLTPQVVNSESGAFLHQFRWIDDDRIGSLSERWNHIPGASPTTGEVYDKVFAVHWTEGGPWFPDYRDVPYADEYNRELALVEASRFSWRNTVHLT